MRMVLKKKNEDNAEAQRTQSGGEMADLCGRESIQSGAEFEDASAGGFHGRTKLQNRGFV